MKRSTQLALEIAALATLAGLVTMVWAEEAVPWYAPVLFLIGSGLVAALYRMQVTLRLSRAALLRSEAENARLQEATRVTQMLVHDIRKPFSLLSMTVQAMQAADEPHAAVRLLTKMLPDLQQAANAVDSLIRDVMGIESGTELRFTRSTLDELLLSSLHQVFLARPTAAIDFSFELKHSHRLHVDVASTERALTHIVEHVVRSLNDQGKLRFQAKEVYGEDGTRLIELTVGHAGSSASAEARGAGSAAAPGTPAASSIGIAFARKILTAQGGVFISRSSRERGIEFCVTLPAASADLPAQEPRRMPPDSQALIAAWRATSVFQDSVPEDKHREQEMRDRLAARVAELGRPLRLMIVDDEAAFVESTKTLLGSVVGADVLAFIGAADGQDAIKVARTLQPDIIICDVDLGTLSPSGFETVAKLRESGIKCTIVMHSNRPREAGEREALKAGANSYLRKPARRIDLLERLTDGPDGRIPALVPKVAAAQLTPKALPCIAVVDDSLFVLEAWTALAHDAKVETFLSPEAFWERLEADPGFLDALTCIVVDYYFDTESDVNGLEFAQMVRHRRDVPIFLSTDTPLKNLPAGMVAIDKTPQTAATLATILQSAA